MIKFVLYAAMAFVLPVFFTCSAITNLVLSDEDEIALGQKLKVQMLADPAHYPQYHGSSQVIAYVNTVGMQVAGAQRDRANIPFTFTIIDDTVINAFSLPGGPVFIYKGLLKATNSGAEVACVIAHEIGHITMRHGATKLVQSYGLSFLNQIIFGNDSSVTTMIAGLLENLLFLKFSRDDEYQADSCAVVYGMAAQYNPYGLKNFFQTLLSDYGDCPMEVLSDHPATSERMTRVQGLINKIPGVPPNDTTWMHMPDYAAVKTKL